MNSVIDSLPYLLIGRFPDGEIGGLALTLILSVVIGLASLVIAIGFVLALLMPVPPLRWFGWSVSVLIRGLPSLVFLFWIYFLIPRLLKFDLSPWLSATIALSLYHGAYMGEDLRGGIEAVGKGQWDAARALGLHTFRIVRTIVLPQALRAVVPILINRYINLFIYTSVVSLVGVLEFTRAATLVNNRDLVHPIAIFGFVGITYFCCCYAISSLGRRLERRWDWAPRIGNRPAAV